MLVDQGIDTNNWRPKPLPISVIQATHQCYEAPEVIREQYLTSFCEHGHY